jgi:hypothetical protein
MMMLTLANKQSMAWVGSAMRAHPREGRPTYRLHQRQLGAHCPGEKVGILEGGQDITIKGVLRVDVNVSCSTYDEDIVGLEGSQQGPVLKVALGGVYLQEPVLCCAGRTWRRASGGCRDGLVAGALGIMVSEGLSYISRTASCCFFFCNSSSTFFSASVLRRSSRLPMSLLTCSIISLSSYQYLELDRGHACRGEFSGALCDTHLVDCEASGPRTRIAFAEEPAQIGLCIWG